MKKCLSWLLALAMSAALTIPAAAAETAPLPQLVDSKSYFLTNYDVNQPFSLTFSQVIDSHEPQMGNIEITLLKGGVLRCDGDYAYVALAADDGWKLYDGPQDAAYFADRGIQVTPTVRMENTTTDSSKYTQGYTWQFNRPGTYVINAGCAFYKDPEFQKFTVKVLDRRPDVPSLNFVDVPADAYCVMPVTWAVANGITTGTSETTFSPNVPCTNAQILTFLWRATGKTLAWIDYSETGVAPDQYYTDAVRWAISTGILKNEPFPANEPCTRARAMEYFWKLMGCPTVAATEQFTDIPEDADYRFAVSWALSKGITTGTGETTFSPDAICTRAQIVTFLYRFLG